jgi:hypothetical protein
MSATEATEWPSEHNNTIFACAATGSRRKYPADADPKRVDFVICQLSIHGEDLATETQAM